MAEAPAYTTVPGKIPQLLGKIRDSAVPPKATVAWLKMLGFTSSNDSSLISVLKQIGFADANGVPQPAWKEYRGADYKAVLGRAIVLGYDSLYATYSDAHDRSKTDLGHVLTTHSTAGKQAIDKSVTTFKNLAKEAIFDTPASDDKSGGSSSDKGTPNSSKQGGGETANAITRTLTKNGVTININVSLTLPATTDEKVFEAFFGAMKKYLIDDNAS